MEVNGWGHSQIIVQKDANGFTEAGRVGCLPYRTVEKNITHGVHIVILDG